MDNNKLKVLQDIGYSIKSSCGLCKFGVFRDLKDDFGACTLHSYQHEKHTGEARQLSVHRNGSCASYELDTVKAGRLGRWAEFL